SNISIYEGNPDYLRLAAENDMDNGDYDLAMQKLRIVLKTEPNKVLNLVLVARALTQKFLTQERNNKDLYEEAIEQWQLVWQRTQDQFDKDECMEQLMKLKANRLWDKVKPRQDKNVDAKLMPKKKDGD